MKIPAKLWSVPCALVLAGPAPAAGEWTSLFNGKDATGWKVEGEARIEVQVDRRRVGRLMAARNNPEPASEAHRPEVVEPGAFPVTIGERLDAPAGDVAVEQSGQGVTQGCGIVFGREQDADAVVGPGADLARQRFVDRIVGCVLDRDRQRAGVLAGCPDSLDPGFGNLQPDLQPVRHDCAVGRWHSAGQLLFQVVDVDSTDGEAGVIYDATV